MILDPIHIAYAKRAYHTYAEYMEWHSITGAPLPEWDQLPEKTRCALVASTLRTVTDVLEEVIP